MIVQSRRRSKNWQLSTRASNSIELGWDKSESWKISIGLLLSVALVVIIRLNLYSTILSDDSNLKISPKVTTQSARAWPVKELVSSMMELESLFGCPLLVFLNFLVFFFLSSFSFPLFFFVFLFLSFFYFFFDIFSLFFLCFFFWFLKSSFFFLLSTFFFLLSSFSSFFFLLSSFFFLLSSFIFLLSSFFFLLSSSFFLFSSFTFLLSSFPFHCQCFMIGLGNITMFYILLCLVSILSRFVDWSFLDKTT